MKSTISLLAASVVLLSAHAQSTETVVCSYPGYGLPGGREPSTPVIIEFAINGEKALALTTTGREEYRVLQNNKWGVVLAHSMSHYSDFLKRPSVGGWMFAIRRDTGDMARNNTFPNDGDAYARGKCIFR
jgi:hypothetical protein